MLYLLLSGLFIILSIWITGFMFTFREQLTCMVGMMAAMTQGMTIGLALGGLFAIWLPGQFFQSTVISMLVGGAAGVAIGWPISLMAVMDGLLSGIMGGMMGTMLMVMMPAPFTGVTVKIISILCSGILFLLFVMLQGEIKSNRNKSVLFSKPILMFIVICIFLGLTLRIPFDDSSHDNLSPNPSHEHSGVDYSNSSGHSE